MTQEEKQLLLKDISARLPYKVKCRITKKGVVRELKPMDNGINIPVNQVCDITLRKTLNTDIINDFDNDNIVLKPYLRPMSSMTEEECTTLSKLIPYETDAWKYIKTPVPLYVANIEQFDFFHRHHLDWRDLIPKGLAIEAPEDMYKTELVMEKFDDISFYGHEDKELQKEYKRMFCNMAQEEKQLLLKDLYARLPHGRVICGTKSSNYKPTFYATIGDSTHLLRYIEHDELKPYLRPMSSMTEDEQRTLDSMCNGVEMVSRLSGLKMFDKAFDWLNSHHFDYHGLIEKGLALEAPDNMYKSE